MDSTPVKQEIEALVRCVNRAWRDGRIAELSPFFDADVVLVAPGFAARFSGRAELLRSFEEFVTHARTHEFRESEFQVEVWGDGEGRGDTAVCTYRFDMVYEMETKTYQEAGREIWVLRRAPSGWRVVWRTQMPVAT